MQFSFDWQIEVVIINFSLLHLSLVYHNQM